MREFLFIVCFVLSGLFSVFGQRVVPGKSVYEVQSFKSQGFQSLPLYEIPAINNQALIKEDKENIKYNLKSARFAIKRFANISLNKNGSWQKHGDLNVWRIKIKSPGAFSLSLQLEEFLLPPGARMFVYNTDMTEIRGAFSDLNNNEKRQLMIAPVSGDEIILEYQEPEDAPFRATFRITEINHDYKGLFASKSTKAGYFGDSGYCNINMSCLEDESLLELSRSVVKIIVDGTELCSGALLNFTEENGKPKLLTAAHCLRKTNSPSNILLFFNYDSPHCYDDIEGSDAQTLYGGTLLAFEDSLDFAFYELDNIPPNTYRPYYAGWDAGNERAVNTICIHHPLGDVKKYAKSELQLGVSTLGAAYTTNAFRQDQDRCWFFPASDKEQIHSSSPTQA